MPYAPGISYRGDQYLYSALSGVGQDIAQAMQKQQQLQQQDAGNDILFNTAKAAGVVTPEEEQQYLSGNIQQRNGITSGLAARLQNFQQQRALLAKQNLEQSVANWRNAEAQRQIGVLDLQKKQMEADQNWTPSDLWVGGTHLIERQAGKFDFDPNYGPGADADQPIVTDPLTINGQTVPGIGVNRKTGQYVYFGDSGIIKDPQTGTYGTRDTRGNFKPLTRQQLQAMQDAQSAGQPPPQQQPSWLQQHLPTWLGGVGGMVVSPAPSPSPIPSAPPTASPSPAATAAPRTITTQADFDALPSGTVFIAPDGSRRRKP